MSKVTILTKPNRIVIASKGVQGPPGPGGGGGGIPDAPSDGATYGRKDGEWEGITPPTLESVLDAGAEARLGQELVIPGAIGLDNGIVSYTGDGITSRFQFQNTGLHYYSSFLPGVGFSADVSELGGAIVSFAFNSEEIALTPGDYNIKIPVASGTVLLDSDIGTLVAAADAIPVWVEITQAAYDALDPPDPNTLYVVID